LTQFGFLEGKGAVDDAEHEWRRLLIAGFVSMMATSQRRRSG
jgi:hypothetical protein